MIFLLSVYCVSKSFTLAHIGRAMPSNELGYHTLAIIKENAQSHITKINEYLTSDVKYIYR